RGLRPRLCLLCEGAGNRAGLGLQRLRGESRCHRGTVGPPRPLPIHAEMMSFWLFVLLVAAVAVVAGAVAFRPPTTTSTVSWDRPGSTASLNGTSPAWRGSGPNDPRIR